MTQIERRIKVIEHMLDEANNEIIANEIGIEIKREILLLNPNRPDAAKIEQGIVMSKNASQQQAAIIKILERKLTEAKK